MSVTCLIDHSEWETLDDMHDFLRRRMKRSAYYEMYHPRVCLQTGEKIPFKDYKQYFAQEFRDAEAMQVWFNQNPEKGVVWMTEWLKKRKEEKQLVYAPSLVELRSLQRPPHKSGYYRLAAQLGFSDRYVIANPVFNPLPSDARIICDTREQAPLKLSIPTVREKVSEGDYALAPPHDKGVYIERKSLADFVGSINCRKVERKKATDSSFERFDRELARAKEKGSYIIMLVEASLSRALKFDEEPEMKWTKVNPSHVFKNLRDLLVKYPLNFQVLFARDRTDAAKKMVKLFQMGDQVKKLDLQYAAESGLL